MKGKGKSSAPAKPKVTPPPAKWRLNNDGASKGGESTDSEKKQFNTWAQAVIKGNHPKTEADRWDSDYEVLKTKKMDIEGQKGVEVKCCSIRLSQGNRVYFYQIDSIKFVKVLRTGDHKPPSW